MIKYLKISWNGHPPQVKDSNAYEYLNLLQNKKGSPLTLIDIGGAAQLRIPEYTTHILDFQPEKLDNDAIVKFGGDIELSDTWIPIFDYVENHGKFDFVVCSHTLEDLNAPQQVILNLFKIGNAGLIALPTKFMDTKKWERHYGGDYLGYHHHRWIYTMKDRMLRGFPKMGLMENTDFKFDSSDVYYTQFGDKQTEISFLWENSFDMEFIPPYQYMDNFTHPERKSRLIDLMERDDIDDLLLNR